MVSTITGIPLPPLMAHILCLPAVSAMISVLRVGVCRLAVLLVSSRHYMAIMALPPICVPRLAQPSSCPATGAAAVPAIRVSAASTGLVRRSIVTTRTTCTCIVQMSTPRAAASSTAGLASVV